MSSDRDTTRIVRSWLEDGANVLPDRVLDSVLDQLPATPQRGHLWQAWRNPLVSNTLKIASAGAAALAVAVIGIGLYFNQPGGIGPPAPSPSPSPSPTAVEIAEAYIAARNAYDPVRARELLADNFTTDEPPDGFRGLSSLELAFENHRAWGFQHSLEDCRESEQTVSPDVAVVDCDSLWTTEVHLRGDYPPTPETFRFRIRDGRISSVAHSASDYDWYFGERSFYEAFLSEHLEFRALVDENHNLEPEATREVIELLPEYFDLYEEWLSQQP